MLLAKLVSVSDCALFLIPELSVLISFRRMIIEELDDVESNQDLGNYEKQIVRVNAKMALVGAGARILFCPTFLYNVLRKKIEADFRWWDEVDEYLLLGAVPFPKDIPHLKQLAVGGVITLNEPYETLVPSSLYNAHGIDHLMIPARDYLFAPSFVNISRAVQFIHIQKMQLVAVQDYSKRQPSPTTPCFPSGDSVFITKADLEGYGSTCDAGMELAIVPKVPKTKPMIARLSCLFHFLKVSGNVPLTRRLPIPEARAC